jgi:hypothetical protein
MTATTTTVYGLLSLTTTTYYFALYEIGIVFFGSDGDDIIILFSLSFLLLHFILAAV